ncbi:MAG TPA: Clp protease N-terminal domain-containing protein [Candidatus Elarobacter sp.]
MNSANRDSFTAAALRAVTRAHEAATMFGSPVLGTEYLLFGLAGGDDGTAAALTAAVDQAALKARLGTVTAPPSEVMTFTPASKDAIRLAFSEAGKLDHAFIGTAHLALGIVDADPFPLAEGVGVEQLRAQLEANARAEAAAMPPRPEGP